MPTIEETIDFIEEAFGGKIDKSGELKYLHSIAVMRILPDNISEEIKLAALLHDVPEDTAVTIEELRERGYSELTCKIVERLNHDKSETGYQIYINQIIESGLIHEPDIAGAILIKYADICHNTSPGRLEKLSDTMQKKLSDKYILPKIMLRMAVKTLGYEDYDPGRVPDRPR